MDALDLTLLTASLVTFFVVIDPIGVAPIFAGLTEGSSNAHRRTMAIKSVLIATVVLFGFAYLGEWLLNALHISLDAFRAAGGVLLFMIALDMIFEKRTERREERAEALSDADETIPGTHDDISVFPMAIPMLAGPGAIAYVPEIDQDYVFDEATTLAILAGFAFNRRVMVQGYHGTGKSTHIEQVAARLNWPMIRVNLDSHISPYRHGRQGRHRHQGRQADHRVSEGILPWAVQRNGGLVFDEYDAGRPDVMFVIQRVLESSGRLTLLDQNRVITPHPAFRLFATTNTVGLGDTTGLYHGTQQINQGQMDRWSVIVHAQLSAASTECEHRSVQAGQAFNDTAGKKTVSNMVRWLT
jgi:cobaltochelatase CobS subunit